MFGAFERAIAFRYLRARGQMGGGKKVGVVSVISAFSIIGIALGVATLIIVLAVRTGFRDDFVEKLLSFQGHIDISRLGEDQFGDKALDFEKSLEELPGVKKAIPRIERYAMAKNPETGALTPLRVQGIRPNDLKIREFIDRSLKLEQLQELGKGNTIVIGGRLAKKFGIRDFLTGKIRPLQIGDEISVIIDTTNNTAFGLAPRSANFKIVGIFEAGMSQFDEMAAYISLDRAQIFFKLKDIVPGFEVLLDNPEKAQQVSKVLQEKYPDKYISDWMVRNHTFLSSLDVEKNVMFVILALIMVIAAFNIISSLSMLVKDKRKDIAIMRSMGATRSMVLRIFFLTGASIGILGTIIGVILGVVFCLNIDAIKGFLEYLTGATIFDAEIYYLSKLPAKLTTSIVLYSALFSLTLSFLATLFPAWKAAKLDPVEGLRRV